MKIATLENSRITLPDAVLNDFRTKLSGDLVCPDHPDYDEVRRVWNGLIDRRPALIVRCANKADVLAAVNFVRTHNLRVSVRGGGHHVAGKAVCDDGLVIDLGRMKEVEVDAGARKAMVQAGARLGEVDEATRPFGLAVPVGVVSHTGISGLTLHGGMGWLLRRDGLTIDNLLAVELITADGEQLVANAEEHADLFWALRGGGGNFGIVTSFTYRLRPIGEKVWFAAVFYPLDVARQAIAFWKEFMDAAPEELSSFCVLRGKLPEVAGARPLRQPVVAFLACYSGPFDQGEEVIRPLREWARPVADLSGPKEFHLGVQRLFDRDYPDGRCYYWDSLFFDDLDEHLIDRIVSQAESSVSRHSSVNIWALGGAMNRVEVEQTAFDKRDCGFMVAVEANWDGQNGTVANRAWVGDFVTALRPESRVGGYLNFSGAAGEQKSLVQGCYNSNFARLQEIKRRYDPANFWRANFNISPACNG